MPAITDGATQLITKNMNFFLFIAFSLREMSFIQMFSGKFSLVASFALREFAQSNKIP